MKIFAGVEIPESLQDAVRPDRAALVVYDMQVGILRQLPDGAAVLGKVLTVLEAARSAGVRVIFMRHMSLPKRLSGAFQLRQMMGWQRKTSPDDVHPWFLRGNPAFELAPELGVREDEAVLDKITMSAFEGTPLSIALRDLGLTSFVIAGIATEIGIEPTVRHGSDLGFIPVVVTDACGAGHAEAGERALANMRFMGDAVLCTADELKAAWAG
ncbi:cysteine hydrolase [Bradyrhizobium sp. LHD-71]|uniref:cysteine hydrolase family protein n=1 Tax=Bradyrhizobium sp. LHD-71 TaxID=3072141 RepID=UPI00280E5BD9|nr:cysteine hydrolase [Bradyrhizobium sp. LHD-71]MDQ8729586.1 cysteine hydrolase [Bradyrhizobium sp. LHD-71]